MIKNSKKRGVGKIFKRKPHERISEALESRIAGEVLRGEISMRAASTKYCIHRKTLGSIIQKVQVKGLLNNAPISPTNAVNSGMKEKQVERASTQQIKAATEELKKAKLKIEALETMIAVAEDTFKIKILKKAGARQSRDSGKNIQK